MTTRTRDIGSGPGPWAKDTPRTATLPAPSAALRTGLIPAVVLSGLLGGLILYGVALSPVPHDVAHDARHAIGFPCH